MGKRFLHSPGTLRTRGYCFLSNSDLGEVVSYEEKVVDVRERLVGMRVRK